MVNLDSVISFIKAQVPPSMLPMARKAYKPLRSRIRIIKRARKAPLDLERLKSDLKMAGIGRGDMVMVHSSLSSIGNVDGGAETVIRSFLETVTSSGTVTMPCYNSAADIVKGMKTGEIIDLRTSPSGAGKITEVFRTWPGTRRSSHPFSSSCAWGAQAEYITSSHAENSRVCHAASPVGRQVELGTKIIGIGIPIAQGLGVAHFLEDTWDEFPLEVRTAPFRAKYMDAQGNTVERDICRFDSEVARTRIDHDEGKWICGRLTAHFLRKRIMKRFKYGHADSWIMEAVPLFDELKRLAQKGITMYTTEDQLDERSRNIDNW